MVEFIITAVQIRDGALMTVSASPLSGDDGAWLMSVAKFPRPQRLLLWKPDTLCLPVPTSMLVSRSESVSDALVDDCFRVISGLDTIQVEVSFPVPRDMLSGLEHPLLQVGQRIYILPLRDNSQFT